MKKLILASQSPQRLALFKTLGLEFEVKPADLNEKEIIDSDPQARVVKIAQAKAESIKTLFSEAVVVAADSFIVCEGKVLEKPLSVVEAEQMLTFQSGKWVTEYTGLCYLDPSWPVPHLDFTQTQGLFRALSLSEINRYIAENPVLTWSGAFSPAYPAGAALIAEVKGSLTGFTHGFPLEKVVPLLRQSGFNV